ncbi:MAG: hypothetical protein KKA84_12140 [Bacteroidetes bacterium]|nr:hypothetical protein [Bacteroidota bacterium]
MYCDYKINSILDVNSITQDNAVIVNACLYEGDYQDILNEETGETENQYVRTSRFYEFALWYEDRSIMLAEIEDDLKEIIQTQKGNRDVIAECI